MSEHPVSGSGSERHLRLVVPADPAFSTPAHARDHLRGAEGGSTDACPDSRAAVGRVGAPASGPMQRPVPTAPTRDAQWPSMDWWAHYSACPQQRKCRHRVVFPDWWLAMTGRGRFDADVDVARERAVEMINGYKGHPRLQPAPLEFVQKVALDALPLAPAPIGESWVRGTFAAVSGLARWLHMTGQPLTREHAFAEETRFRYIATLTTMTKGSGNLYAVRLELIGDMLLGVTPGKVLPKVTKTQEAPIEPLTLEEEADLWVWAINLRRTQRREAVTAVLVLGLGCGLTRTEKYLLRHEDVIINNLGVHVRVTSQRTGQTRLVTCRADWEDRLIALKEYTQPGHMLMAPWRTTTQLGKGSADEIFRRARNNTPIPVNFNNIRLRNTWLCRHLAAGTPLKVLMEAADMKEANHLHNLLALLPATDPVQAASALRGTRADGGQR